MRIEDLLERGEIIDQILPIVKLEYRESFGNFDIIDLDKVPDEIDDILDYNVFIGIDGDLYLNIYQSDDYKYAAEADLSCIKFINIDSHQEVICSCLSKCPGFKKFISLYNILSEEYKLKLELL